MSTPLLDATARLERTVAGLVKMATLDVEITKTAQDALRITQATVQALAIIVPAVNDLMARVEALEARA